MGKITVIGIGPGSMDDMTPKAKKAIEAAEVVAGYTTYIDLIKPMLEGKEVIGTGMMQEVDRCKMAVESAASGLLVGIETAAELLNMEPVGFPQETAIGALGIYISQGSIGDFQPMNINFGIISGLDYRVKGKRNKNAEISKRSLTILDELIGEREVLKI